MNKKGLLAAIVVFGLLPGYFAFYYNSPGPLEKPTVEQSESVTLTEKTHESIGKSNSQDNYSDLAKGPSTTGESSNRTDVTTAVKNDPAKGYDIEGVLTEIETLLLNDSLSVQDDNRLAVLQDEIEITASINSDILDRLINLIRTDPSSKIAGFATTIMMRLVRPETHQLGLELVEMADRSAVVTGLDLLSSTSRIRDDKALAAAQGAMAAYPEDGEVLLLAIDVVSHTATASTNRPVVLDSLRTLSTNQDDAVRQASLFAISKLSTDSDSMMSVIQALDSEIPDDRVSAVMAIQQSEVVSDDIKDALLNKMTDENELWEIRRIAADSLVRFDLTDDQAVLLGQFRGEQGRVSQGG